LANLLYDLKGIVRVFIRVRPCTAKETSCISIDINKNKMTKDDILDDLDNRIILLVNDNSSKKFEFDRVF